MRDPAGILSEAGLTGLIDPAEPACVILSAVLHFIDAAAARDVAAAFARAIAPGSYPGGTHCHLPLRRSQDILKRPSTRPFPHRH
jgi:hypothetical protein